MKKPLSKAAFTLLELIVATSLVSIVLLGVFAISGVLSTNTKDYAQRYLVKSSTQTTLNRILNDASQAVGSGTNVGTPTPVLDQGTVFPPGAATNTNFCFHEQNPGDTWSCYEWDNTPADAAYKQIWSCAATYNANSGTLYRGSDNVNCAGTGTLLGTAYSVTVAYNAPVFSIVVQNCFNDTSGTCGSDPVNNPQVTLNGAVVAPQQGTG